MVGDSVCDRDRAWVSLSIMPDVTQILNAIQQGDPHAAEQLLPLVYDELRKLAAQRMAQEKPGQTLQATALVHDAYLRLVDVREHSTGTAAATSSPPRPRPCGAFWSRTPAARKRRRPGPAGRRQELLDAELAVDSTGDDLFAVDEA